MQLIIPGISHILCQNNEPTTILTELYKLLSRHFPIDTLSMATYASDKGVIHYKAFVINKNAMILDEPIKLSLKGQKRFNAFIRTQQKVLMFNNSKEMAYAREVINFFRVKDSVSTLIFYIQTGIHQYTGIVFAAYGQNRYTENHVENLCKLENSLTEALITLLKQLKQTINNSKHSPRPQGVRDLIEYQRIDLVLNSQNGLRTILDQVEQVAPLDSPVLITGETGVGKELVASLIHGYSKRVEGPFICVNCGAIPESLLDSELFGYEKGAFTGAVKRHAGFFEQADGGSLFLDEVGELSLTAQVKLLRALQNKMIQRVGGIDILSIDVRVMGATNRNLLKMIKERAFRQDLWYRLNVFPIEVPPLRERKNDIPSLVQYLINNKLFEMNLPFQPVLANEAMDQLLAYDWPGNVRELQNVIERALILCNGAPLKFPNLAIHNSYQTIEEISHELKPFPTMEEMMITHIQHSLELSKGKIEGPGGAAKLLGMNPSTLRARMRKLGIKKISTWAQT